MTGLELSLLDVGYNVLRRVPSAALSRTRSIDTLVMDGNLLLSLEKASIANINVINISVRVEIYRDHCSWTFLVPWDNVTSTTGTMPPVMGFRKRNLTLTNTEG